MYMMGNTRMETYYGFVSTSEDALALFEACRLGYKQRVPRRLSDDERAAIRSGSVFVWEETESGMKRWTDGRSWSPSRVQGCFLTYHEWEGRRRAQRHPSYHHMHGFNMPLNIQGMVGQPMPMGIARYGHFIGGPTKAGSTQVQYGFPKENGMLKKALSIRTTDGKKLHIIAYYSKEDHAHRRLMTPTSDPNFPRLVVPPNLYPDMSPESMYGASHSMNAGGSNEPDYPGPATAAQTADSGGMHAYEDAMMSGNRSDDSGSGSSSVADRQSRGAGRQLKANDSMDIDIGVQQQQHRVGMQSPPVSSSSGISASATHNYTQQQYYSRRLSSPSPSARISHFATKSAESAAKAAAAAAAVDALSVGLHRARVQSLVMDTDVPPSLFGNAAAAAAATAAGGEQQINHYRQHHRHQNRASRPAPETNASRTLPAHPMSAPSSSGGSVGTRPSSNSFSGQSVVSHGYHGRAYQAQMHNQPHGQQMSMYEAASLGLSASSSSAPASSGTRSAATANLSFLAIGPHAQKSSNSMDVHYQQQQQHHYQHHQQQQLQQPHTAGELGQTVVGTRSSSVSSGSHGMADHSSINETPSLPPMPSTAMPTASGSGSGSGRGGAKYLGLGGPLGLSGLSARRTANVRSVTSAAVMVNSTAGSRPKLPLLLSPVNPSLALAAVGGPLSAGGYAGGGSSSQSISLAGIRRDMREGPRRLPSISASIHRRDSSPTEARCIGGGLGIFNAGIGSSNGGARNSSLLPSPMPTPRQAMHQGFDADRAFPPSPPSAASAATGQRPGLRSHADSLSILASAAGRAQVRHASSTHRSTISHHPYLRTTPWRPGSVSGPSMRSVSLKQSEDIRQLGVLDQSLRLK